jgi:segregation and condensation protein A
MTSEEGKRDRSERADDQIRTDGGEQENEDDEFEFSLNPEKPDTGSPSVDDDLLFDGPNGGGAGGDGADEDTEETATDGGTAAAETTSDDEALPESDEETVEPVEVLVNLAEKGEIDPWDIDIVEVTDAFLAHLDESDLRTTGRALFYASVLLRMKSDEMLAPDEEEEPEPEPWELAMQGGDDGAATPGFDPVTALEDEMDRRLDRKSTRGNPETLDELVRELREAERGSWWKKSRSYDTSKSPGGFARGTQTLDYHAADDFRRDGEPTAHDVTNTTHNEDIEEVIADVHERLREHYDHGREEVLFVEVRDAGGRPVMTYLALLFLAHRGAVRLQQDDLFGDLWVRDPAQVDPDTDDTDEAEADETEAEEAIPADD